MHGSSRQAVARTPWSRLRSDLTVGAALAMLAAGGGCASDRPDELRSWDEFRAAATRVVDGKEIYVVEWDLAVSLDELRARYEAYARGDTGTAQQPSTVNQIGGIDDIWRGGIQQRLTYCVSNEFGGNKARAVSEMAAATQAWESVARVDFIYLPAHDAACNNTNPNVVFSVRPWFGSGACAFFPSGGGCVPRTLVMSFADFDTNPVYQTNAPNVRTVGVFRHELGHILGLRHEHTRPESGVCFEDGSWRAVTPYDRSSVMHYPWCNGTLTSDLGITRRDAIGAGQLYGDPRYLVGDVNADGRADIIHPSDDGTGGAQIDVSLSIGVVYTQLLRSANLGEGSGALAWLTGDVNGDGRTDLIQPFDNAGRLGLIVYGSTGTGYTVLSGTANTGQGSGALAWLTGDVNGDGRTDLIQPFDNAGRLGIIVYGSTGTGFTVLSGTPNMGQGSTALAWLTGDVNNDHRTDVIQLFDNGGRLGIIVYGSTGTGFTVLSGTPNMGQGSAALAFRTGDVNGDGRTDIIQTFDNAGRLGMIVYVSNGTGFTVASGTLNTGEGSAALAFLTGDVNGDGRTDLIQPFDNAGRLGLIVYTSNGTSLPATFGTLNTGHGSGALAFLTGDMNADGRIDLLQPTANGLRMGLLAYTSNGAGLVHAFETTDLGAL